jgi:hypothetical protein
VSFSFLVMDMFMDCDSMLLVEGRFGGGIVVEGMSFLTYVINPPPLMLLLCLVLLLVA